MITNILLENIKTLLQTLTSLQIVSVNPDLQFSGFPSAFVAVGPTEAEWQDQDSNKRVYEFHLWLFQEYDTTGVDSAYSILNDEADKIMNKIDLMEDPELSDAQRTLKTDFPAGYSLTSVHAATSVPQFDTQYKLLGKQIILKCSVLVDITLLT